MVSKLLKFSTKLISGAWATRLFIKTICNWKFVKMPISTELHLVRQQFLQDIWWYTSNPCENENAQHSFVMLGYIRAKYGYYSNREAFTSPPVPRKLQFNILKTWCWFPTFPNSYSKTNKIFKVYVKVIAP